MLPHNTSNGTHKIFWSKYNSRIIFFGALGLVLFFLHLALMFLSHGFATDIVLTDKPVLTFVILELIASAIFLATIFIMRSMQANGSVLIFVVLVGMAMRVPMMASTPILENDFNRYLLDGTLVANGYNPYRYSPMDIQARADYVPRKLLNMVQGGKYVIENVNYPHLRTIYPPVAQVTFALAYLIKPCSLLAWKFVLSIFDLATAILLLVAIRDLELSSIWIAVYWWNPLVLREIFNSAHMDVIILPFVIGALLLNARRHYVLAVVLLALATGTKLWPLLLLPILLWPIRRKSGAFLANLLVFGIICGLFFVPIYMSSLDDASGFMAYSRMWEMNDALYMMVFWAVKYFAPLIGYGANTTHLVTRLIAGITLIVWIAWVIKKRFPDQLQMWEKALLIVACLFMVSPTQFPWYYVWVIPFLTVRPRISLFVLNALLPFYYIRFYFQAHHDVGTFDTYLVWLQYIPAWILMGWEVREARKGIDPWLGNPVHHPT